jgi:hypothetical protein
MPGCGFVDILETRLLLAAHPVRTISGHIFNDLNGNGTRQTKEHFLAGVAVYVDLNGNSVQDAGEPSAVTNKLGAFTFKKLPPGVYDIVAVAPAGDVPTIPSTGITAVNVTKHSVLNLRYGFKAGVGTKTPPPDTAPPSAALDATALTTAGFSPYRFSVTWSDSTAVDASSFGDGNLIVTGPDGYDQAAGLVGIDAAGNGSPRTTTYQISAPAAGWTDDSDGTYTIMLNGGQIRDTLGNIDGAIALGTFTAEIPAGVPGAPALVGGVNNVTTSNNSSAASKLSFTISNTIAGAQLILEADGTPLATATAADDSTTISTNGSSALADGPHQFAVTQTLTNGLESTSAPATITVDTAGPTDALTAAALTTGGASTYTFTVAYTDATAVSVASLGGGGLLVTAPTTQHITPTLVSLDTNADGPMRTATYSVAAPGGTWTQADNGSYTVTLLANSVFDEVHNVAMGRVMGSFTVSIGQPLSPSTATPVLLAASDTGTYSNDDLTNLNNSSHGKSLQISVPDTQVGAKVTVFSDGTPIGSATAAGTTTTITTNGALTLTSGTHLLTAGQTVTGEGASNPSLPRGIVVDTQAPTATSSPAPVSGFGATVYTFSVVYRDNIAVDESHLGNGDAIVTGPNAFSENATLLSVNSHSNGSPLTAMYSITPPGGSWQSSGNGTYTISLQGGQVFDTAGNAAAAGAIGNFVVNAGVPASPVPGQPNLLAATDGGVSSSDDITDFNNSSPATALQFSVGATVAGATITIYADGEPIGAAVATGSTTTVVTNGTLPLSDGPQTITARQAVPGDGQSSDSAGLATFIDTTAPTIASYVAPDVTATGGSPYTFNVTYADATAVDVSRLGNGDIIVNGPNNIALPATFISADPNTDGPTITATYQITPPGGSWSADDSGAYTLNLQINQVHDIAGNTTLPTSIGTFAVNIAQPITPMPNAPILEAISDTGPNSADDLTDLNNAAAASELQFDVGGTVAGATVTVYSGSAVIGTAVAGGTDTIVTTNGNVTLANGARTITAAQTLAGETPSANSAPLTVTIDTIAPTAGSLSAGNVSAAGATTYNFSVTYSDNRQVDFSSLGSSDVLVTGPGNISLPVSFVSANLSSNSGSITATYQITPPGGSWNAPDNGTYAIALQGGQVRDTAGNTAAAGTLGSFNVNVAIPTTSAPSAPILTSTSDSGSSQSDRVTNLNNSSPATTLQFAVGNTIPGATVTVYSDGTPIGATVAGGTSVIVTTTGNTAVPDGAHAITARQQLPGEIQSGDSGAISITIDTTPPTAVNATLGDVTTPGGDTYTFSVTFADNVAVDPSSFGNNNVVVSGPDGFIANATLVAIDSSTPGAQRSATYVISAPAGGWSAADDGAYAVSLNASQVMDIAGNAAIGGTIGTFNVSL